MHHIGPFADSSCVAVTLFLVVGMAPRPKKVYITRPIRLKRGYYFQTCRRYQSGEGIFYDYELYNPRGQKLVAQARGWRKVLSYNFPLAAGGLQRLDLHRVFGFNSPLCNVRRLSWSIARHVHHHPFPRRRPWSNCTARNLLVMSLASHTAWHRAHPDVPDFCAGPRC